MFMLNPTCPIRILSDEERKIRAKESGLRYRQQNRAREREKERIWRENNRIRYNLRKRNYWAKNKDKLEARRKELKLQNYEHFLLLSRIRRWRIRQKKLALQEIERRMVKASSEKFLNFYYY